MSNQSIEQQLQSSRIAISNSLSNQAIKDALAIYLIDEARIIQGQTLLDTAESLHAVQKSEYGEQYAATEAVYTAQANLKKVYDKHLAVARVVFKKDAHLSQSLQINGRRKKSLTGWMTQVRLFYTNALANAAAKTALATYGVTEAHLQQGQTLLQTLDSAKATQEDEKGEAQKATEARDAALDALDDWMDDFKQIALVALADDKQLLESLGFGVQ